MLALLVCFAAFVWPALTDRVTDKVDEDFAAERSPVTCQESALAKLADACHKVGDCFCCLASKVECKTGAQCKSASGSCAEMSWKPSLKELQEAHSDTTYKGRNLASHEELKSSGECKQDECNLRICSKKRGWFGTGATVQLGLSPKVRELAAQLSVWHWNPHPPRMNVYTSTARRWVTRKLGKNLDMSPEDCKVVTGKADGSAWDSFLDKLNVFKQQELAYGFRSARFTYVITAPQDSTDIEWRIGKQEGRVTGKALDYVSKHAFLADFKDWVIMAGEMWIQIAPDRPDHPGGVKPEDLMLVMDNDSGTFAPGADPHTRIKIRELITTALNLEKKEEKQKVAVCAAGKQREAQKQQNETDACPHQALLYQK